uniref:Uncharacterized protein n=1 Tax=Picea sitchensis TaxID=3332 RepID=A9P241_PICSI|nr:unknown [Picea sitchensis]
MWPFLLGGKKIYSSLSKRSNLYGRSMNLTFFEHIFNDLHHLCVATLLQKFEVSLPGKIF